jgi:hypothetical protein
MRVVLATSKGQNVFAFLVTVVVALGLIEVGRSRLEANKIEVRAG